LFLVSASLPYNDYIEIFLICFREIFIFYGFFVEVYYKSVTNPGSSFAQAGSFFHLYPAADTTLLVSARNINLY